MVYLCYYGLMKLITGVDLVNGDDLMNEKSWKTGYGKGLSGAGGGVYPTEGVGV